jgi:prepilin-type N-terminal cleavage/methylation domain-containing protein
MTASQTIRRGFSMIELLIVVAISMLLIAIAIPFVRPALASSKLREASRQVNAFLVGAKARAAETGRPFGVRLIRSNIDQNGDANDCYRLRYVEVPPYYSGDIEGALIEVGGPGLTNPDLSGPPAPVGFFFYASVPVNDPANLTLANYPNEDPLFKTIDAGDLIRFGYVGGWYRIDGIYQGAGHTSTNDDVVLRISVLPDSTTATLGLGGYQHWPPNPGDPNLSNRPLSTRSQRLPYQIMRRPRPSGSMSIELPKDVSIDLSLSGFGAGGNQFVAASPLEMSPIDIVFSPAGQVEYLFNHGAYAPAPAETIYLLVGNTDQVWPSTGITKAFGDPTYIGQQAIFPHDPDDFAGNIASGEAYWVGVQQSTGAVLTAENLGSPANYRLYPVGHPQAGAPVLNGHQYPVPDLSLARDIVRSGVARGSR